MSYVFNPFTGTLDWTASNIVSGGFQQPTSGVVDGSNQTFTWSTEPNVIVVDGVNMQKVSSDGTGNWTGTTTTLLTVPPTRDIFSIS